ncbi:MAG TPA: CHASE domain-containing protein [Thermoanaerobaculia bacterium]|jgi:signal transduction histidine kinase
MSRDRALPAFVLIVFLLLAALATVYVWNNARTADRGRFDNAVQSTGDDILRRIEDYGHVLDATRALVAADPAISRERLITYIRGLDVQRRFPGILGVGLTLRVPREEVPRLRDEMRRSGFPDFRVWPETPRDEYHTVVLLEPLDRRNRAAIGYDMFTDPIRREAMIRARDSGRAAASGKVTLVQEIELHKQPGFLLYLPIYTTGRAPDTVRERREALIGFVYAPFRTHDLFSGIFGTQARPEVSFAIFEGNELLYRTGDDVRQPRYTTLTALNVAGRRWTIHWSSRRSGAGNALILALATTVGGIAIAILLFLLLRTQLRARETAEATAARLRLSEAELQRANNAKDEFLATLSHELRTPMTSILGWSQLLAEGLVDESSANEAIEAIQKSAKVQAQLIDDLLDVSRITAGKLRVEKQPTELLPVITAAADTVRTAAETKGVALTVDAPPGIGVNGDAHRLQQVVWNLLTNAVKFTPRGGSVAVRLLERDGHAHIAVTDTGQGIDPEFMPHLFERFRQADSSMTRSHMGLGLGLAIVRHLVELHGGTIEAESTVGHGSTFHVRLPLLTEGEKRPAEHAPGAPTRDALAGRRLLIVDDDEEVRNYVRAVFRDAGEVRTASSAHEAMELLAEWRPDVIVTDIGMPRLDGYDLLMWIREQPALTTVPVVALTAFAMPEDRQRAVAAGFQGFVAKPVEPERLKRAVATASGRPGR